METDEEIVDFLNQRGAIEIQVWLVDGPKRFSELHDRVGVARATLSKRLQQGSELGLWMPPDDHTSSGDQTYCLDDVGESLEKLVREINANRHLQSLYNARQDFQADQEELIKRVAGDSESE
jgi:DNA-binding HxlR family transcriptional regulator